MPDANDYLRGMKAISDFLGYSESTIIQWMRQYDNFPVKKNGATRQGSLHSSKNALTTWRTWWFSQQ